MQCAGTESKSVTSWCCYRMRTQIIITLCQSSRTQSLWQPGFVLMQMCHCYTIEDTHLSLAGGKSQWLMQFSQSRSEWLQEHSWTVIPAVTMLNAWNKQYSLNQGVVLPTSVERFCVTNLKIVWSSLDRILCHQGAFILLWWCIKRFVKLNVSGWYENELLK
jgi:hypothetical protein